VDTRSVGRDIWIRASHNKLAHECAAGCARMWEVAFSWLTAILVAVPTVSSAWALFLLTSSGPSQNSAQYERLSLVAALAGGIALTVALVNPVRSWGESQRRHLELSHNYGRIAQRTRRLDAQLQEDSDEARWLVGALQDDMETQKNAGCEASRRDFVEARKRMQDLRPLPFALEPKDLQ
jgi:hypothetical protein